MVVDVERFLYKVRTRITLAAIAKDGNSGIDRSGPHNQFHSCFSWPSTSTKFKAPPLDIKKIRQEHTTTFIGHRHEKSGRGGKWKRLRKGQYGRTRCAHSFFLFFLFSCLDSDMDAANLFSSCYCYFFHATRRGFLLMMFQRDEDLPVVFISFQRDDSEEMVSTSESFPLLYNIDRYGR